MLHKTNNDNQLLREQLATQSTMFQQQLEQQEKTLKNLLVNQGMQIQTLMEQNKSVQSVKETKGFQKKRPRKRKPIKDPVSFIDLKNILKDFRVSFADPVKSARYRVACVLLYLLGIRINETRQITMRHLNDYLGGNSLYLVIGKSKVRTKVEYPSAPSFTTLMKDLCYEDLQILLQHHGDFDPLIPYSRAHFTREMNKVFKSYGNKVNKTFGSHSCRVAFITRVCKTAGIEAARVMVGHSNISTTQVSNRNYLSHSKHVSLLESSLELPKELNINIEPHSELESLLHYDSTQ